MPKYTKPTRIQIRDMIKKLEETIIVLGDGKPGPDAFVRFKEPYSDTSIAQSLGISLSSVQYMRKELHGKLQQGNRQSEEIRVLTSSILAIAVSVREAGFDVPELEIETSKG